MARFASEQLSQTAAINTLADADEINSHGTYLTEVGITQTLTAAEFINGTQVPTGSPGATAMTVPTAADIIAAIPNVQIGSRFQFFLRNETDNTITVTTNTGITLDGTVAVPTAKSQIFTGHVTSLTAVTIVGVLTAAI
jgi:hypothetical protein